MYSIPLLIFATLLPLLAAIWVATDAKKRGASRSAVVGWFIGVFLVLIVFLPLYLIFGRRKMEEGAPAGDHKLRICPYCGRMYRGRLERCPYCNHEL